MWLEAPVEEIDDRGRHHRTTRNKDEGRGSPQGSPLSPLLANIYMRRFILGWKTLGHEIRLDAHIVNYADDFVICCRGTADEAMRVMRSMMSKLRLTVNEAKTRTLPGARGERQLPGLHDRAVSLAADGSVVHRYEAVGEEDRQPQGRDPRVDQPEMAVDDGRGPGGETEPEASGLVELLLSWAGQPGLSSH